MLNDGLQIGAALIGSTTGSAVAVWLISILVFALILWRPRRIPEYIWALGGAVLLIACGLISPADAGAAARAGTGVYLFLFGMMLLAELAAQHGVFDWLAAMAMHHARASQLRLFTLVYGIGVLVTALLSNDATAVLLTPAVLAVVRRAKTSPLPYLFACAFVANAASFLLPISNPANLVLFRGQLPTLASWISRFLPSAIVAVLATFGLLWWHTRHDLKSPLPPSQPEKEKPAALSSSGIRAGVGVLLAAGAILATSAMGGPVGLATAIGGVAVMLLVAGRRWRTMASAIGNVSWGVVPLVAGLFVIVRALQHAGALALSTHALELASRWPPVAGLPAVSFGFAAAANAINNLPVALIGAAAARTAHTTATMHGAMLLGINLGPNLSVTGSLATILWLMALRRAKVPISGWRFLRAGLWVMPIALLLSVLTLVWTAR